MAKAFRLDKGQIEVVGDAMADILRHKSPAERISIGFGLWLAAHDMLTSCLRQTHPEWSEVQLQYEVARRMSHGAA